MPDGGELPSHGTPVELVRKQLPEVFAHIFPPRSAENNVSLFQKLRELCEVARVSRNGQLCRPALDP
jgi:hypothetical protein